jgi:hypothetical protein
MAGPLTKGSAQVRYVKWDEIVQAFTTYASNQPFAMSIGGGHTNRRSQYVDAPALDRFIQTGRERLVSIVQQKLVILIAREGFPQLLQSPLRRRMFGDIEVKQTSGSDLEGDEYIKDTETHRHGNEEVAGDNFMCMVPEEGRPALILAAAMARRLSNVFSYRAW